MCNKLTSLHLEHNQFGAEGLTALVGVLSRGALPYLRELDLSHNQSVNDWRQPLLALAEAVSPISGALSTDKFALSRLQSLNLEYCHIGHQAFFYFCRGLRRGALPALTKLNISGNGVENSGIEPLAQVLSRGALPALRIVQGIPKDGMQLSDANALLQLKHLRELATHIDSKKNDNERKRGTALRPAGKSRQIEGIERLIRTKQEMLDRARSNRG